MFLFLYSRGLPVFSGFRAAVFLAPRSGVMCIRAWTDPPCHCAMGRHWQDKRKLQENGHLKTASGVRVAVASQIDSLAILARPKSESEYVN